MDDAAGAARWREALARSSFAAVAAEVRTLPAVERARATRQLLAAAEALLGDAPDTAAPPRVELELLGSGAVRVDGERRGWPLRRALLAVAYLALAPGRQATKDELVDAAWPDATPGAVRRNFHPTLSAARGVLGAAGNALVFRHGVYRLSPDIDWRVDCEELEAALAEGEALLAAGDGDAAVATWRRGWRLYRGPLLAGHDHPWIQAPRERLRDVYLRLLRRLGDLTATREDDEPAIDAYRALLVEDPMDEAVHAALMRLYGRHGRRDLVRRQFVRLQGALDEIGVLPQEETLELYHRLVR